MTNQISFLFSENRPMGTTLLDLRGATQNLSESMSTKNVSLIIKRQKELFNIINSLENISIKSRDGNSFVKRRLAHNLSQALIVATFTLRDASTYLSEQLYFV